MVQLVLGYKLLVRNLPIILPSHLVAHMGEYLRPLVVTLILVNLVCLIFFLRALSMTIFSDGPCIYQLAETTRSQVYQTCPVGAVFAHV